MGVYPRVCGGSTAARLRVRPAAGLSPRVRGKPAALPVAVIITRSIPACAGEALWNSKAFRPASVYPRVCGGSIFRGRGIAVGSGLSPRVRGKRFRWSCHRASVRSIPACAGEAFPRHPRRIDGGVYPRVCGGSRHHRRYPEQPGGLSPRVRGKRRQPAGGGLAGGSIPACAGEAMGVPDRETESEVYPRVCGGSGGGVKEPYGLSRSIPACAGEAPLSWGGNLMA